MLITRRKLIFSFVLILAVLIAVLVVLLPVMLEKPQLAFYLVKEQDPAIWLNSELNELTLEDTPLLTDQDLLAWRWSDHTLFLLDEAAIEARLPAVPTSGLPFVIVVNQERIYLGAFWVSYSSQSTDLPVIDIILEPWQIRPGYPWAHEQDPDVRNDRRLEQFLKRLGIWSRS